MAAQRLMRQFAALGGSARVRLKDGQPLVTDNGQHLLDVTGLQITDPLGFEVRSESVAWRGDGRRVCLPEGQVCLLGTADGVKTLVTVLELDAGRVGSACSCAGARARRVVVAAAGVSGVRRARPVCASTSGVGRRAR